MNPGLLVNQLMHREPYQFDACLRMVSFYDAPTDSILTRLDVLLNTERNPADQYNMGFSSSVPASMGGDDQKSYLSVPARGILGGMAVNMSSLDLCEALRALADAVEAHKK